MTKNELKEMANRIKKQRELLLYTQEGFCEVVGISASSYTKIENAFQKPSLDTLIKIAQQLHVSLDYLVFGTQEGQEISREKHEVLGQLLLHTDMEKLAYTRDFLHKVGQLK